MTLRSTLALFALSVFAVAAEPPAPVHESAEVTLVTVPVTVLGRDGKPVRGLGAADFELEDDGVAQTVLSVDTVDLTRRGTDAEASSPRRPDGGISFSSSTCHFPSLRRSFMRAKRPRGSSRRAWTRRTSRRSRPRPSTRAPG